MAYMTKTFSAFVFKKLTDNNASISYLLINTLLVLECTYYTVV
jgi:hypothetical protein